MFVVVSLLVLVCVFVCLFVSLLFVGSVFVGWFCVVSGCSVLITLFARAAWAGRCLVSRCFPTRPEAWIPCQETVGFEGELVVPLVRGSRGPRWASLSLGCCQKTP